MSTYLLVDVGNSSAKWWLEKDHAVVGEGRATSDVESLLTSIGDSAENVDHVALASVAARDQDATFLNALTKLTGSPVHLCRSQQHFLGLTNSYNEPETMGVDRWLAMLGAWRPDAGPVCVVDVGTAVTIDLVNGEGQHEGGYILPGPRLMQDALTGRAQRIEVSADTGVANTHPGTSTSACVKAGAWLATAGALHDIARRYPDHRMVVCGGDGQALLGLGFNAEWRPGLVREGLSRWLSDQLTHSTVS